MEASIIGGLSQTAWTAVFSFTHPPTTIACRGLCTAMRRFMQQDGFWRRLLREQFGCEADDLAGMDPYEAYVLMASQRRLRRSRRINTQIRDPRPLVEQTDQMVAHCGARPGDIIDFGCLASWLYVGRNTDVEVDNKFHLIWSRDDGDGDSAAVAFLFTKHFRNAMWMLYDVVAQHGVSAAGIHLASDDDFVVSLFGCPLPDGTALRLQFSSGGVSYAAICGKQNYEWITVQLKQSRIPCEEAATYHSLADCARGNRLAKSGADYGCLYELDLDDESTAAAARAVAEGTFCFKMPFWWKEAERQKAEEEARAMDEPVVVVSALSMPEPTNDDEYKRMEELGKEWNKQHPESRYSRYSRRFALQSTEAGAQALVQEIHDYWQELAGNVRVSRPVARRFSSRVRRIGSVDHASTNSRPIEDFSLARYPRHHLGGDNDYERFLVPEEVTFKWKDYRP